VLADAVLLHGRDRIMASPGNSGSRRILSELVEAGGLMSYGPN